MSQLVKCEVKNFKIRVQVSGNRPGFEIYLSERVGSHSVPDFDITNLHVEGTLTSDSYRTLSVLIRWVALSSVSESLFLV